MLLVQSTPTEIRQLDLDAFRLELRDLEDNIEGAVYPVTVRHTQPTSISGVTLARVVEIINNYTVTFEDGQYAVNIIGGNSNVGDVTNVNQVSVRTANSAGATITNIGSGLSTQQNQRLIDILDLLQADEQVRETSYRRLHRDTNAVLVDKVVTRSGDDIDLVEVP